MGDQTALKEFLQRTPSLCKVYEWGSVEYNEPEWARRARIGLSLDAMTQFILDDSISTRWLENYESKSPLFLQIDPHPWMSYYPGWGRGIWIQDLGLLKHKPAYEALREVWLHDQKESMRHTALTALSRLQDKRLLGDLRLKLKRFDTIESDYAIDEYLSILENFQCDEAIDIIVNLADILRSLYKGRKIGDENSSSRMFNCSEVSHNLRSVMYSLEKMGTEKSRKAMEQIFYWFPYDSMICGAYKDLMHFRKQRDTKEPELVLPEGYDHSFFGIGISQGNRPF